MADAFSESIERLRKKSRTLLARVGEQSKRVDEEVKKLHSQTLSSINHRNHKGQGDCVKKTDSWKVRNDSSEVSAILCPDYSLPDTMPVGKLTLTSKKARESPSDITPRKPSKECYCRTDVNKSDLRSSRTQRKRAPPCRHCRSHPEFTTIRETEEKAAPSSPISCETFRRVQRIDYTPRSQFLRNVQSKICELQSGGQGDHSRTCPRSSNYHRFMASTQVQNTHERAALPNERKRVDDKQASPTSPRAPANSLASEQSERDNACTSSGKAIQMSSRRPVKSQWRKTLRSRRPDRSEQQPNSSSRSKRPMKLRKNCPCCQKELVEDVPRFSGDARKKILNLPGYSERRGQCSKYDDGPMIDDSVDHEVADLRKFREQNYFETHGSCHTLASSRSSGSLQQYLLNERLFPEPVSRIRKQDLVVTMPPCATTQKKRIHYFPRYVVRQEKNMSNANYKRKRCQSCPLTGHAIDLGILKAKPPLNSLALKYQKRTP
ncbi:hypothetical protein DMN91_002396 [Ooceraea biroi]|uniref:Uncharacterized protein n=1 Tax=Ooceraea biroi TaxID=2015173 RepID=A0A3L8DWZ3_OOCBI|nr:uncharacterized protein LOC105277023 [Ooceraea biroi]RLU24308.1 hypothetical protein DMN91_002396 [Ooceraea biroi]